MIFKARVFSAIVLTVILILMFAGCASSESIDTGDGQTDIDTAAQDVESGIAEDQIILQPSSGLSEDSKIMEAFRVALHGDSEIAFSSGEELNIDNLAQAFTSEANLTASVMKFAVVDLDYDGVQEIVLWMKLGENESVGSVVFRYQDDEVCGYVLYYRGFNELKTDGTFSFSSSASDGGFGKMTFKENEFSIEKITYSESFDDSSGNRVVSYFVNNEYTTESEFLLAMERQWQKSNVVWRDYSDGIIDSMA